MPFEPDPVLTMQVCSVDNMVWFIEPTMPMQVIGGSSFRLCSSQAVYDAQVGSFVGFADAGNLLLPMRQCEVFVGFTLEGSLKFGGFYLGRVVLQVRSAFPQAQCAGFAQDGC